METIEISRVDMAINQATDEIGQADKTLALISGEYMQIKVTSPDDRENFATATEALKRIVRLRNDVERKRKALKKDALRYGKAVDGESNRVKALIAPIEDHLNTQCDIVRLEQKRLEVEAENKRREEIAGWVEKLNAVRGAVNPEAMARMTADEFEWYYRAEKSRFDKEQAELQRAEEERKAIEAERKQIEAERLALEAEKAELAKLRAEAEPEHVQDYDRGDGVFLEAVIPAEPVSPFAAPVTRPAETESTLDTTTRYEFDAKAAERTGMLDSVARFVECVNIPQVLEQDRGRIQGILNRAANEIRGIGE